MAASKPKPAPKPRRVPPEADKGLFLFETIHDPYEFVLRAFPWGKPGTELERFNGPDFWQQEVLEEIGRQLREADGKGCVIRIARATGHGSGKSAMIAWLILWGLSTFKGANGIVTANTETQLITKTWPELTKWYRLSNWLIGDMLDLHKEKIGSPLPLLDDWRIDRVTWSEQNTDAFQGLHNIDKRILCLFDEASGIPETIWDVTEGALTDQATEILWIVFGNPTRNTGAFKDCFTGLRSKRWDHNTIDTRTCRYTNKTLIKEWIEDYGIDSDFVKVRVRGMFPSISVKQFIPVEYVDAAKGRKLELGDYAFAPKIIGVDTAWEGDDDLVISLRQGLHFKILRVIPKNDNDNVIGAIVAFHEDEEKADKVNIDLGGGGNGLISYSRTVNRAWRGVWFGGKSPDPGCLDMRAYMWKKIRDWLREGGAFADDKNGQELYHELIGPETIARLDGKIQIESKDSMKRRKLKSPNMADSLGLTLAFPDAGLVRTATRGQVIDSLGRRLLGSYEDELWDPDSGIGSYL